MDTQKTIQETHPHLASNTPTGHGRRRARIFLWTALLWLAALLVAPAVSFAQPPLSDDADSNNGNTPNLTLSARSSVYLKFNLTPTLPANTPGARVAKATVKLYLSAVKSPGSGNAFLGTLAGDVNTAGSNNTVIGATRLRVTLNHLPAAA